MMPSGGCTSSVAALRLPFTCGMADGRPLSESLPRFPAPNLRQQALEWRHVAIGIMLNKGVVDVDKLGGRAHLERALLLRSRETWMPQAHDVDILLLGSCPRANPVSANDCRAVPAPAWFPTSDHLPKVHWHCFHGREKLGASLWRKTGALLALMHRTFPAKRMFLKVDSDTMVMPRAVQARNSHSAPCSACNTLHDWLVRRACCSCCTSCGRYAARRRTACPSTSGPIASPPSAAFAKAAAASSTHRTGVSSRLKLRPIAAGVAAASAAAVAGEAGKGSQWWRIARVPRLRTLKAEPTALIVSIRASNPCHPFPCPSLHVSALLIPARDHSSTRSDATPF